ncbi:peptide-methionine (S)-S-oxide reductase MsrA, partial [Candidatus Roizmanbacteria bacterium]|nr:peptide-methionine (S)-S-oxide reductase MsrA [Candidatus Roizmanbacteria bacterium]
MAPTETAVFGGGCFWCTEAVFKRLKGVAAVTPGYAGGTAPNPDDYTVNEGESGHAEVVQIVFDPTVISYPKLLSVFWYVHSPTSLNRQGPDEGTQYRSVILYTSLRQKDEAEKSKREYQRHLD